MSEREPNIIPEQPTQQPDENQENRERNNINNRNISRRDFLRLSGNEILRNRETLINPYNHLDEYEQQSEINEMPRSLEDLTFRRDTNSERILRRNFSNNPYIRDEIINNQPEFGFLENNDFSEEEQLIIPDQRFSELINKKKIYTEEKDPYSDFITETDKKIRALKDRLISAGFDREAVESADRSFQHARYIKENGGWPGILSDNGLKVLATLTRGLPYQEVALNYLHYNLSADIQDETREIVNALNGISESDESGETLENLRIFFGRASENYISEDFIYSMQRFSQGLQIITDRRLFNLFGSNLNTLREFQDRLFDYKVTTTDIFTFNQVITRLRRSPNAEIFLDGFDYRLFDQVSGYYITERLLDSPDTAAAFNRYWKSGKTWVDKIQAFKGVVRSAGIEVPQGIESDREFMDTVRRRESGLNPLNTLKLATSVGPEIEYPHENPVVEKINKHNVYELLNLVGFRRGGGVPGTMDEASPGPFFSPETVIAVYRQYADAKIINSAETIGMNAHFNVGQLELYSQPVLDKLIQLTRGLYLTGAGYNPYYSDGERSALQIGTNEDHYEAKVFDVTTDEDFEWNFKAASYLTWAIKAKEELGKGLPGEGWRKQMAGIWDEYVGEIGSGLAYLGRQGLLSEARNVDYDSGRLRDDIKWHDDQMKAIWSDPDYFRLPNLRVIGQKSPDNPSPDGIEGVMHKGVWYPNIAIFSRTVIGNLVGKIESIADSVEDECRQDIVRIESVKGKVEKRHAIRDFIKKYGIKLDNPESRRQREKAFNEVKDLLLFKK